MGLIPKSALAQARAAVAAVVSDPEIGSVVRVLRNTELGDNADGSVRVEPIDVAANVPMTITSVAAERLQNVWGLTSGVTAQGVVTDNRDVQEGDGLIVTSGLFAGQQFQIQKLLPRPVAGALLVGLIDSPVVLE